MSAPHSPDSSDSSLSPASAPGLHDLGNAVYAYLQPAGTWGWSNAGLIVDRDSGAALLVDTLFDLPLTRAMLDAIAAAVPRAAIGTVVNTHANGDHCWGNQLIPGARIVASRAGAAEMAELPPAMLGQLIAQTAAAPGPLGAYLQAIFGAFRFDGIALTPPTETFDGALTLRVGDRRVELYEVGPAHTRGDVLVHVPDDRVVFTGDILFCGVHPVMWQGPLANWRAACRRILDLDVDVVVPGHGPLTDKAAVERLDGYLGELGAEVTARWQAGMSAAEAARDIAASGWLMKWGWGDPERIVINAQTLYRELEAEPRGVLSPPVPAGGGPDRGTDADAGAARPDVVGLFGQMAALSAELGLHGLER